MQISRILLHDSAYLKLTSDEYWKLKLYFELPNPAYKAAQKLGLGWNAPAPILSFIKQCPNKPDYYKVPRFYAELFRELCAVETEDNTVIKPYTTTWQFDKPMRDTQQKAIDAFIKAGGSGVINLACGAGKSKAAARLIHDLQTTALILVDQERLAMQWKEVIQECMGVTASVWMGAKRNLGPITIATFQSLYSHIKNKQLPEGFFENFGMTIYDETHIVPASTFSAVASKTRSKYVLGLSATVKREDGLSPLIFAYSGPIVYTDLETELTPTIKVVNLDFEYDKVTELVKGIERRARDDDDRRQQLTRSWGTILTILTEDPDRNRIIVRNICDDVAKGHKVLVSCPRIEHCKEIQSRLQKLGISSALIVGPTPAKERARQLELVLSGEVPILIVTSLGKKGLDIPMLSSVHLSGASGSEEYTIQFIGRILRTYGTKSSVLVYDYVDLAVPIAKSLFYKRLKVYKQKRWLTDGKISAYDTSYEHRQTAEPRRGPDQGSLF